MSVSTSFQRKFNHFARLPWREKGIVVEALALLPLAWMALGTLGLQRSAALLRPLTRPPSELTNDSMDQARRVAQLVAMAARNNITPANCLRRSLVLWFLLRQRRLPAELLIGVRKADGQLQAHAWVELAGTVLNDAPDVAKHYAPFTELPRVISPR
jgi:hypothetical protein